MYRVHAIGRVSTTMPNIGVAVCSMFNGGIVVPDELTGSNIFNPQFSFPTAIIAIVNRDNDISFEKALNSTVVGKYGSYKVCKVCMRRLNETKAILDPVLRTQLRNS